MQDYLKRRMNNTKLNLRENNKGKEPCGSLIKPNKRRFCKEKKRIYNLRSVISNSIKSSMLKEDGQK